MKPTSRKIIQKADDLIVKAFCYIKNYLLFCRVEKVKKEHAKKEGNRGEIEQKRSFSIFPKDYIYNFSNLLINYRRLFLPLTYLDH